jgi:hypothetical protein
MEVNFSIHTWDVSTTLENSLQPKLCFLLRIEFLQEVYYSNRVNSFCDWLKSIDVSEIFNFLDINVTVLVEFAFFTPILWLANRKE